MGLTTERIEEFLDRLNDDTEFRDRLICNTASVFDEYGISYTEEDLVAPSEVQLPPPGAVNENRAAFRDALFPIGDFDRHAPNFTLSPAGG